MRLRLIEIQLDDTERRVLRWGLVEWLGPARPTQELAQAMGFADVAELQDDVVRLGDAIDARAPLTATDWVRALLATEIVFISDVVGSGSDWEITVGLPDDVSLRAIRRLQRKIVGLRHQVIGQKFGTLPPDED